MARAISLVVGALLTTSSIGCASLARMSRAPLASARETPPPTIGDTALAVGVRAPTIEIPACNGASFSLEQTRKTGPVVLVFYRGEWCPSCVRQLSEINEHTGEFTALNVSVVGISPDSAELSQALVDDRGLVFPILIDADHQVIERYGLYDAETRTAWPTIYVVDRGGVLRYRGLAETKEKRPTAEIVLAALRALAPIAPETGAPPSSTPAKKPHPLPPSKETTAVPSPAAKVDVPAKSKSGDELR